MLNIEQLRLSAASRNTASIGAMAKSVKKSANQPVWLGRIGTFLAASVCIVYGLLPRGARANGPDVIGQSEDTPPFFEFPRTVPRLPFTSADLATCVAVLVRQEPRRAADGTLVFEPTMGEHGVRVVIMSDGLNVLVRFWVKDDYGIDLVNRFCRVQFFGSHESELLLELLFMGPGMHWAGGTRFDVLCEYRSEPEQTTISFFFSPPIRLTRMISIGHS